MATKSRGINTSVLIEGNDLSNAFKSFSADVSVESYDGTAFQDTAKKYVPGFKDGKASLEGFYDGEPGTADGVDDLLRPLLGSSTKKNLMVSPEGASTLGNPVIFGNGDFMNLKVTAPANGLIMETVDFQASAGLAGGVLLAPLTARTATGNGTAVDNAASSANGGRGQLQISAKSGTTPTLVVKIQHSTDSSTWVDLISFSSANSVSAQQASDVTGTVNRYTRETHTIGGTSPSFTYAVGFARF